MSSRLPSPARRYLISLTVGRLGTGLTLPYTLILLHEVRGIALPTVGLLLSVPAVVGLVAVPLSGTLVDRVGPRAVLAAALLAQAVGMAGIAFATTPTAALPALLLTGVGMGPSFPAGNALLNGLLDRPELAHRAFGVQFTIINASIGIGTLVASRVVDVRHAATFEVLYVAGAVCCAAQVAMLPSGVRVIRGEHTSSPGSYREVLRDRVFRRICLLSLASALTGYAALDSGLPAYARVVAHVSPAAVGLAYTVNTVLIVALQLPVLRWIRGWRRTRALAVAALLWGLSWGLLGLARGVVVLLLFAALFGLGEVFVAPAMQPLINAVSTARLRGRYNALSGSMFSVAFVVSPAISALLIGNGLGQLWIAALCAGSLLSALGALLLRRMLTDGQDGLPGAAAAPTSVDVRAAATL